MAVSHLPNAGAMGGRLGKAWPVVSTGFTALELARLTSELAELYATYKADDDAQGDVPVGRRT